MKKLLLALFSLVFCFAFVLKAQCATPVRLSVIPNVSLPSDPVVHGVDIVTIASETEEVQGQVNEIIENAYNHVTKWNWKDITKKFEQIIIKLI